MSKIKVKKGRGTDMATQSPRLYTVCIYPRSSTEDGRSFNLKLSSVRVIRGCPGPISDVFVLLCCSSSYTAPSHQTALHHNANLKARVKPESKREESEKEHPQGCICITRVKAFFQRLQKS